MNITITKADFDDLTLIHRIQVKAFTPILDKYQDYETNPASETIDHIIRRYNQDFTTYWLIKKEDQAIGAVRIIDKGQGVYRVSPIFILPSEQGKGIAQKVFQLLEDFYIQGKKWELETILEEEGLCYLYEKLGYVKTGQSKEIKIGMTIVYYEKKINP